MMEERIILVNKNNQPIGAGEKLAVHQKGQLHRAFSVLIFNSQGKMLLQKRASHKYHSGGLWSNACCSHPRVGEELKEAVSSRLIEEIGIKCKLKEIFSFTYKVNFKNGLIENEFDYVFLGKFDGEPKINLEEAEDCCWKSLDDIKKEILLTPEKFTFWFKIIMNNKLERYLKK